MYMQRPGPTRPIPQGVGAGAGGSSTTDPAGDSSPTNREPAHGAPIIVSIVKLKPTGCCNHGSNIPPYNTPSGQLCSTAVACARMKMPRTDWWNFSPPQTTVKIQDSPPETGQIPFATYNGKPMYFIKQIVWGENLKDLVPINCCYGWRATKWALQALARNTNLQLQYNISSGKYEPKAGTGTAAQRTMATSLASGGCMTNETCRSSGLPSTGGDNTWWHKNWNRKVLVTDSVSTPKPFAMLRDCTTRVSLVGVV